MNFILFLGLFIYIYILFIGTEREALQGAWSLENAMYFIIDLCYLMTTG